MADQPDFSQAIEIARIFLEKRRRSGDRRWGDLSVAPEVGAEPWHETLYWGGSIPLFMVRFADRAGTPSGYVLVSTDRRLPPVLEYTDSGPGLIRELLLATRPAVEAAGITVPAERFIFFTSSEIYIEYPSDRGRFLLNVRDLWGVEVEEFVAAQSDPETLFDPKAMKRLWKGYTPNPPGEQPQVELTNAIPVRYQQNCNGYTAACRINLSTPTSPCRPAAISGCVPVAWAMLLSAWKKTGYWNTNRIWASSTCWSVEWPSWGPPFDPSQCSDVNATIWRLNALMGTDVNGGTYDNHTIRGAAIFGEMGMNWQFARANTPSFDFAVKIVAAGQPFLWTANGIWSLADVIGKATPIPGGVGHGVCCYGYKKADRTLLIALGWGTYFSNKYVSFDQYALHGMVFVIKVGIAEGEPAVSASPTAEPLSAGEPSSE